MLAGRLTLMMRSVQGEPWAAPRRQAARPRANAGEDVMLLPRIYGNKLKISTLSVLLALLVGGRLQGIIGAVLVLPLVAAYPIIERHWLGGLLRARVLTDHKALAKAAESGSDVAMDAVINGEKHASEGLAAPASTGVSTR